jgi:iron complex outermembrane receptor protein
MNTQSARTMSSVFGLVAFAALAPTAALAQAEVSSESFDDQPIVVTAQRRAEAQVDVPITVTTLGAEQLQTSNVQELSDIVKVTPGLRFDNAGGFFQPTIRGIGTAVTTSGGGGNVGIYVDGFYSPNPLATNMQLLKLQSIQVLKGPQGTLFGRNTTGGAILIQTAEPSTETGGEIRASYGRYNEARAQGYLTYGISDTVAMDFEGLYSRGDGWQRDITSGKKVGDYENWSARIGLKADFSDTVSLLIRYQHGNIDDPAPLLTASYTGPDIASGAPFFAQPGQFTFKRNEVATGSVGEFFRSNSDVIQATLTADLGFANFTSYSQYRNESVDSSIEVDYSGVDLFQLGLPNKNETWSQEFLLSSKAGTPLQWTAGLFYFENTDTYITLIDAARQGQANRPRLGGSSTTTKSYAAFVDATYEITPQLFVTGGVRYAKDEVTDAYWNPSLFLGQDPTTQNPVPGISDGRVTPRFVVRYKPDDRSSLYASYTKGYKAAIIDVGGSCQTASTNFVCNDVRPETIDAFEIGFKRDDRVLSVELSAFYYDYKNLQVSIFRTGTAEIVNAAKSEIYGLDGQLRYRVSEAFDINLGAAWTHARYKTFPVAPVYTPCVTLASPATCAATGTSFLIVLTPLKNVTMQRTPEFTGNVGARYKAELGGGELSLSGNLFYSSKFFFGPSGIQFPQKGYETLSLRAQWTDPSDTYTIALWGDNVTNSRYKTQVQYASFGIGSNWNKPVTFGLEAGVKF